MTGEASECERTALGPLGARPPRNHPSRNAKARRQRMRKTLLPRLNGLNHLLDLGAWRNARENRGSGAGERT